MREHVKALLYKLKELYFLRKIKPQKGKYKKNQAAPKKRYIIGLKEVAKNLQMQKLNMVIMATNLEKVEGEHGIDELVNLIKTECRQQTVPLVIAMSRAQLGTVTKFPGQKCSIVGIFNYQGAITEFNRLSEVNHSHRHQFYENIRAKFFSKMTHEEAEAQLKLLMKENSFLDPDKLLTTNQRREQLLAMQTQQASLLQETEAITGIKYS